MWEGTWVLWQVSDPLLRIFNNNNKSGYIRIVKLCVPLMRLRWKGPNSWVLSQGPELEGKSEFHGSAWAELWNICCLAGDSIKALKNLEYYEQKQRLFDSLISFFFPLKILPTKINLNSFKWAKPKNPVILHDLFHSSCHERMGITGNIHVWCNKLGGSFVNRIFFSLTQVGLLIWEIFLNRNQFSQDFILLLRMSTIKIIQW